MKQKEKRRGDIWVKERMEKDEGKTIRKREVRWRREEEGAGGRKETERGVLGMKGVIVMLIRLLMS